MCLQKAELVPRVTPLLPSDHYGRLPTIILSNLVGGIAGMAIPFVTHYIAFFILR